MAINWDAIGSKLNKVLHNYAEFVDKYYQFFTGPAQDVPVEYYDINGNRKQIPIPSVAKLRDRFISDVNSVMVKHVYVDAENGSNETGDGSPNAPFKTINKAIDSVPVGSKVVVHLKKQQTHVIDGVIDISGKVVKIFTDEYEWADNQCCKPSPNNAWIKLKRNDFGFVGTGGFLYVFYVNIDLKPEQTIDTVWTGLLARRFDGAILNICVFSPIIKLGNIPLVHQPSGPSIVNLALFSPIIEKHDDYDPNVPLIWLEDNSTMQFHYNNQFSAFDGFDIKNYVKGIVKDTNGVPRNIISNIVF